MTSCNDALAETWIQVGAILALYQEIPDLVSGDVRYGYVGIWIDEIQRTHIVILSLSSDVHKDTVIRGNLTSYINLCLWFSTLACIFFRQK